MLEECESDEERQKLVNGHSTSGDRNVPPLIVAIKHEYPNIVRLLIESGAKTTVEQRSLKRGVETALQAAFRSKRPYIIRMLTESYLRTEFLGKGTFLSTRELEQSIVPICVLDSNLPAIAHDLECTLPVATARHHESGAAERLTDAQRDSIGPARYPRDMKLWQRFCGHSQAGHSITHSQGV